VEKYLKAEDVAGILGLKRDAVLKLAREGKIPHIKLNDRVIRFTEESLREYLKPRRYVNE
jgi:excisionase family DNA binding protein